MRNMLDHPDGRAKLTFEEPMSILELFTDWNFSTDDAMMQHMSVRRKDIVVPLSISHGGKGSVMIIVRPEGNRFHVVRVWTTD